MYGVVESWVRILVLLKIRHEQELMHVKSMNTQVSRWHGVEVWKVRYQLRCTPRLLTKGQNDQDYPPVDPYAWMRWREVRCISPGNGFGHPLRKRMDIEGLRG
ncbi:hypothetical protein TNCV_5062791 [Trichonephila clavipes]|nr:hypothetical protein TNCV_5062791 [Trichonephila clavipes]